MIRGAQKKIVVIKDTKSGIFDEAYFILKNGAEPTGALTFDDMVSECSRIIEGCLLAEKPPEKKKPSRLLPFLCGTLTGFLIALVSALIILR